MLNFDDYRYKGQKFYRRIARALGDGEDLCYADRLVTSILCVLRDRMTLAESLEFIAFLPMHVKGVFVNGWKINPHPKRLSSVEEFLDALRIKYPMTSGRKPGTNEELSRDVQIVFSAIQTDFLTKGVTDVKPLVPEVLHSFLNSTEEKEKPVVEVINEGGKHFPEVQPIKNEV
jgi:uncharacterized protein (DUF2267 family)